jgi:hypothetical protein
MDENRTLQDVLAALDEFLIYRTDGKLQDLLKVRNKLRQERQEKEHAGHATPLSSGWPCVWPWYGGY